MEIIIGAVVSLFVQWAKSYVGSSGWRTMLILLVSAVAAAGVYEALVTLNYWQEVVKILIVAGAFYAFVLQRFESSSPAPVVPLSPELLG